MKKRHPLYYLLTLGCLLTPSTHAAERKAHDTIHPAVVKYVSKTTSPQQKNIIKQQARQAFTDWIGTYSNMGFYAEEDYRISDTMICNKQHTKCLLLVVALLKGTDDGMVKLIAAKKVHQTWEFDYAGKPNFYYEYSDALRHGIAFTKKELIARTVDTLISDGLTNFWGRIDQHYINHKWF